MKGRLRLGGGELSVTDRRDDVIAEVTARRSARFRGNSVKCYNLHLHSGGRRESTGPHPAPENCISSDHMERLHHLHHCDA